MSLAELVKDEISRKGLERFKFRIREFGKYLKLLSEYMMDSSMASEDYFDKFLEAKNTLRSIWIHNKFGTFSKFGYYIRIGVLKYKGGKFGIFINTSEDDKGEKWSFYVRADGKFVKLSNEEKIDLDGEVLVQNKKFQIKNLSGEELQEKIRREIISNIIEADDRYYADCIRRRRWL